MCESSVLRLEYSGTRLIIDVASNCRVVKINEYFFHIHVSSIQQHFNTSQSNDSNAKQSLSEASLHLATIIGQQSEDPLIR